MNRCTIFEFRNAVAMPNRLLTKLRIADIDSSSLTRTRYFAECRATFEDDDILIYAPLEELSMHLVHDGNIALQQAYRAGFVRLEILDNELQHSSFDTIHATASGRCPIIIERLPKGCTLEAAMLTMSRQQLLRGMEELDELLKMVDISHNNLSSQNIIVGDDGRWHPIRQYYTRRGYGGDVKGFKEIKKLIIEHTTPMKEVDISTIGPWAGRNIVEIDGMYEGRRKITTDEGVGFEDEFGEVVIKPQYLWASDFMENRAMVRTKENRMGLINRDGKEIIPTIYDSVEYSVDSGKSIVQCNNLCSIYDYNGQQLTVWHEIDNRSQ